MASDICPDESISRRKAEAFARAAIEAMREPTLVDALSLVRDVHGTFARDIEQGFVTKDKTYAAQLLGKALAEFDAALSEEKTPA